ncbi:MAG TPA: hypothetical protein VK524_35030 [Polyangiaceae bacterium]|nr:hypothetical protein [Polyangiaceae bacterium]
MISKAATRPGPGRLAWWCALLGLLASTLLVGCSSPRTAFDERLGKGRFAFVMGQGSSWHGFDVIRINSRGECWYTFSELEQATEAVVWREAAFGVPKETLTALKEQLNENAFFSLEDEYKGAQSPGRSQWFIKVRIGEQKKAVFLDNEFPLQAIRLEKFISEQVLDPHRDDFKQARTIPAEQGQEPVRF